jgi:hypothetical protein
MDAPRTDGRGGPAVTAGELAAVIVSIASVAAAVALIFGVFHMVRTMAALRLSIEELRRTTIPVVDELSRTVTAANAELARVDGLLESAESVTATVDSASRLAYLAFSNPAIKAMALASGTAKAAKALRRR